MEVQRETQGEQIKRLQYAVINDLVSVLALPGDVERQRACPNC